MDFSKDSLVALGVILNGLSRGFLMDSI